VSRDFLLPVFFHESPSPKPLVITLGSFRIFSEIRGDIRKSRCTTSVNDTGGKFATGICSLILFQLFATGVNDTGGKFAAGVVDTGGKLPPASVNLPLVLLIPVANTGGKFATGVNDTGGKFAAGVNDAGGNLPPVSTTPAANLPLVSLTPVANNWNNIRLQTPESELEGKNLYIQGADDKLGQIIWKHSN
jgi:hypothetical protein